MAPPAVGSLDPEAQPFGWVRLLHSNALALAPASNRTVWFPALRGPSSNPCTWPPQPGRVSAQDHLRAR